MILSSIMDPTDRGLANFLPPSVFIPTSCPS